MHNIIFMKHIPNENLPEGTYRIICMKCEKVFNEGKGEITQAAIEAMRYSETCDICKGEVVLETNPTPQQNPYDANQTYPNRH